MKKWILAAILIALIVIGSLIAYVALNNKTPSNPAINYTYEVVNAYPHDTNAFTEGLVYDNGFLYESTGLNGNSTLRKVEVQTGRTLQLYSLPPQFFGEGITIFGDRIIQITWQSQKGFVYDKDSFDVLEEFTYRGEGWGITHDDTRLIMSSGSATLSFLDPVTFRIVGEVQVTDGNTPVTNLNELEYVNGDVYANVWHQDRIAIINIQTGQVKGWINLAGLYNVENADPENVLNGIAYDAHGGRLFVTGKRWPQLFEIKLNPTG
jgi:glutaminyl-peptide cyclotransferase